MAKWRILKEQPVSETERTPDLSSWSKFVATGETFEGNREAAEAHLAAMESEQGWCLAIEEILEAS